MANARLSSLKAQRSQYKSPYSSGGIRILAPTATGISNIAKQNASNETDIMISKYNAGEIGNAEMKAFFQTQLASPYVTQSDKTQIQTKLVDFDVLIEKDRLEAVFKQAPEDSLQKMQAATALADFYTKRASTMAEGTSAQSTALQNAGSWTAQVANIQDSVNKTQLKNSKNQMLQQINAMPDGSGKAQAAAQMWQKMADLAGQQGDTESQQVYLANKQSELQNIQVYQEREAQSVTKEERQNIINDMQEARVAYISKQISYEDYQAILQQVNNYATDTNDGVLQTTVMNNATEMEKLNAKGGGKGGVINGLPVKSGGAGSGGSGGTSWDDENFKLDEGLRMAQEFLKQGESPDGKEFTSEDYYNTVASVVTAKDEILNERIAAVREAAAGDPSTRIDYNGKKNQRADVVLEALYKEQAEIQPQAEAVASGRFAIKVVPPKESETNPTGSPVATLQPVSVDNIDPDTTRTDMAGFIHDIIKETLPMTDEEIAQTFNGLVPDTTSPTQYRKAKEVAPGVWEKETGNAKIRTYQPGGTQYTEFEDDGSPFGSWSPESQLFETNKALGEVRVEGPEAIAMQVKAKKNQAKQELLKNPQQTTPVIKPTTPVATPSATTTPMAALQEGELGKAIIDTTGNIGTSLQKLNTNVLQPTIQKVSSTIQQSPYQAVQNVVAPSTPSNVNTSSVRTDLPNTIKVNNQTQVKQYNPYTSQFTYQPVTAPKVVAPTPTPAKTNIGTVITGAAGQALNKLKSFFKW